MLYLISITIFFAVGGMFAAGIRLELLTPKGDLWSPDMYNKLFTLHGVVMIFFFLIPSIPATLGNFLLPIMIGTKDLAFPRINLISWYIYVIGAIVTLAAVFSGGARHGLDVLHAVQLSRVDRRGDHGRAGRVHHRLLVDPDRPELHRHRAPHARAGPDLVPPAAVRVGATTRPAS